MCDASSALITYNWVDNHYHPHPNFNVQQKCRNYQDLLEKVEEWGIDRKLLVNGIFRPTDRPVAEFNEPPFDPFAEGRSTLAGAY